MDAPNRKGALVRNGFCRRRRRAWECAAARWRCEAGQTLVIFALTLPVLLGISAIVVDVGNLYVQKRTLQTAVDAAALAAAQDLTKASCSGGSCVASLVGNYTGLNAGTATTAPLQACPGNGNGSCYTWPYQGDSGRVEVKLRKSVPTAFARIFGITQVAVSGRAVAAVSAGAPPPYTFVALNSTMEKHTLLIKTGGNLTVNGSIYTNSENDHDGFDIFGAGGNISAPVIINHGGWETHDGSPVFVNGVRCTLPSNGGKTKVIFTPGQPPPPMGSQPPGCPDVGQPVLADPFAGRVVKPTAGAPACGTTLYNSNAYSPAESLNAAITVSATTVRSKGTVIQNGDIIEIGSERMLVTAPPTPASSTFSVTRKAMAAGVATLTTSANHGLAVGETVIVNISDPRFDGTFTVTAVPSNTTFRYRAGSAVTNRVLTGGTVTLTTSAPHGLVTGNSVVVSINDPRFDGTFPITAVSTSTSLSYAAPSIATTSWSVAGNVATLTATTPPHGLAVGDAVTVTYTGGQAFLSGTYTLTAVTANTFSYALTYANGSGGQNGTAQLATAASAPATGLATLATMAAITTSGTVVVPDGVTVTVTRGHLDTTAAAHNANAAILRVTGTPTGVAASPAPCVVSSGTVTLWPGTYYGGIDIGSTGAACTPSSTGNAQVTLAPGTYIMAGGGLRVCGSSALSAPNVLIYNTNNAAQPSGNGALGQVLLNTTGSVALGPQTGGQYQGLTIFQDPALALRDSQCDNRSSDEWDIALLDMASTGANGKLGSISGTVYAAHPHSLFGDSVSGTANLAVYTGCIRIEGANSTFNFESGGLFGTGSALTE